MKKLLLSIVFSVLYVSSASAELGVNVGVSGQAGLFAASASEKITNGQTNNGTEHGSAGWASIFIEKSIGDVIFVGYDYVPGALETDTSETSKSDMRTDASNAVNTGVNKIQIDFENLNTMYLGANIGEHFYAKAGLMKVDVTTNEKLATGGAYGNTDLDGTMFAVGFNHSTDTGLFVRVEGSYMQFDGATLVNSNSSDVSITLKNLDGVAGKISLGKSF